MHIPKGKFTTRSWLVVMNIVNGEENITRKVVADNPDDAIAHAVDMARRQYEVPWDDIKVSKVEICEPLNA